MKSSIISISVLTAIVSVASAQFSGCPMAGEIDLKGRDINSLFPDCTLLGGSFPTDLASLESGIHTLIPSSFSIDLASIVNTISGEVASNIGDISAAGSTIASPRATGLTTPASTTVAPSAGTTGTTNSVADTADITSVATSAGTSGSAAAVTTTAATTSATGSGNHIGVTGISISLLALFISTFLC